MKSCFGRDVHEIFCAETETLVRESRLSRDRDVETETPSLVFIYNFIRQDADSK